MVSTLKLALLAASAAAAGAAFVPPFAMGGGLRSGAATSRAHRPGTRCGVLSVHAATIKDICAREILDSRGNPTIEVWWMCVCA